MALTPEDVVNKRFQPTKFREGYDQDEVDDFLDEIVVELRRLHQENEDLRKQLAQGETGNASVPAQAAPVPAKTPDVVEEPKKPEPKVADPAAKSKPEPVVVEKAVAAEAPAPAAAESPAETASGVIALAQRLHDEYVNAGVEQRDKIIAEAQIEASTLVNDAQEKSRKTLGALEQQRSVLERKVEQLRGFERDYRSRLKTYIEGQLRDLDARGSVAAPDFSESNSDS
ncbi:DivIVA domain-containing protein [Arthrobacter sp. H35-D1]|uniref:DivIVA domain-containing protein n=1 Tax=Arthrobacter sp. H35-D1 TaxID=3046202 RepID=UPI0024B8C99C|nr:DivIVA domain-containing protein [Arthrobacter sp. H35-D1]MDJ0313239.1 DivIVA domain-containing protein [Arthrobacter sp. H35-D1]